MKSVLISVRPQYCELIASGKKTVEVRKSRPKLETPFKCYIYCTAPKKFYKISEHMATSAEYLHLCDGKVTMSDGFEFFGREDYEVLNRRIIGDYVCDKVSKIMIDFDRPSEEMAWAARKSCMQIDSFCQYAGDNSTLWGWHISALQIYDEPRGLSEFYHYLPDKILYNGDYDCRGGGEIVCMDMPEGGSDCEECPYGGRVYLKRPPESWRYVEELEEPCKTKN